MAKKKTLGELNEALETLKSNKEAEQDEAKKALIQIDIADVQGKIEAAELATSKKDDKVTKAKVELKIMDTHKVNKIFVNHNGEYFTNKNYAELSVKDKKQVKTITREIVETLLK